MTRFVRVAFIGMITWAIGAAAPARADSIVLSALADNTLFAESGAESNGAGEWCFVGRTQNGEIRRTLIRFDLSPIPPGSVVTAASLRLSMSRTRGGSNSIGLFRTLESWGEAASISFGGGGRGGDALPGDATWSHRFFDTIPWSTPGGTFAAGASATTSVGGNGFYTWSGAGMASDVQAWVENAATNHGWIMIGGEASGGITAKRFDTRENSTFGARPLLTVTFTPPAGTGACCLLDGSCVIRSSADCAALSGTYRGNGTSCNPSPCPPPIGACCLPSGLCAPLTQAQCAAQSGTYRGHNVPCGSVVCPIVLTPYVDALPIPPIATPESGTAGGAAHYRLAMTEFSHQMHRDLPPTRVWGYAGTHPGPTILARRGQPVTVEWVNDLRDPQGALRTTHYLPVDTCLHGPDLTGQAPLTVVHLHGTRTAPESDGNPDDAYPPGQSALFTYPNDQRAASLWYHDHALGLTRLNVYMGLAGAYLIRDSVDDALNLPRGQFDIPLVIEDRSFNPDGTLRYPADWHEHFFGDFIVVNGKVAPFMNVAQGKYRFRIINACNSRTLRLAQSDGFPIRQIGSDQGLLARTVSLSFITIAPGERADVIMDFGIYPVGAQVMLLNSAPAPFPGEPGEGVVADVLKFNVIDAPGHTPGVPTNLASVPRTPESQASVHRDFVLRTIPDPICGHDLWAINDLHWDDITEFPRFGDTEVWSFINRSGVSHPMHLHLVSFQILDHQPFQIVDGNVSPTGPRTPPPASDAGWKDTVNVPPLTISRIIARFDGYAGLFPHHCHVLEHEDNEMMRQFRVVCPPIAFATAPSDTPVCRGGQIALSVTLTPDALGGESFQWRRNGMPLANGPQPGDAVISGAASPTLTIQGFSASQAGDFDVVVTSACAANISPVATLTLCAVDFNCDGSVNPDDLGDYINCYFGTPPCPLADFNGDTQIDPDDLGDFINAYFGPGC
ncbi:MAG: multicopper oxidase domain-containing protein [Phycisphaerales bacterium]